MSNADIIRKALERGRSMERSEFETGTNSAEAIDRRWQPAVDAVSSMEDELRRLENENQRLALQLMGDG